MKRWTDEETQYLKDNYDKKNFAEISVVIDKSEGAIRAKCFDLGLIKKDKWNEEDIEYVKKNYSIMPTKDIAKILNRTESAVQIKARRLGLKKYPYNCNYRFFETIDTEEKAYWLGFIASDGWISINKNTNSGTVGIELQVSDIDHLKKFNKSIEGNYRITTRTRECNISTSPNSISEECCIRIFSRIMVTDLQNQGVSTNKTFDYKFPILKKELMPHFIRGYFDGDGCVRIRNRNLASGKIGRYPVCDIVSANYDFLNDLRTFLYENFEICSYIYLEKHSGCHRLYIHKNEHTIKFLNYIYGDANIYLDRKYKIYLEIENYINDNVCLAI